MINSQLVTTQLRAGLRGDFQTGQEIADALAILTPDCPRAKFNRGWYEMRKGNLWFGHKLMDYGRPINVFGNRAIGTAREVWYKQRSKRILLSLEGGLGDQILALRYAKTLTEKYGSSVIVGCSESLIGICEQVEGVEAAYSHDDAVDQVFDYWIPSMSAVVVLDLEYNDMNGEAYIPRVGDNEDKVGLRWVGNPKFEHQQHRLFPEQQFFGAVSSLSQTDLISLQKDVEIPHWLNAPCLDTWEDTQAAISSCRLVITSCTSVAHLSAAMGVETWIVIPILPYYLWALPGASTPYYDSATLFRQESYGDWSLPFYNIHDRLTSETSNILATG